MPKTLEEALAEIDTLTTERDELKTKNGELTTNLTNQRKTFETEKADIQTKLDEATKTITDRDEAGRKELTDYQEKRIQAMAKGDTAIADKIRAEYGNLSMSETSRDEIDARALKAFQLATAVQADPLAAAGGTETVQTDVETTGTDKLSAEATDVYKRMFPNTQSAAVGAEPKTEA